MIPSCVSRPKAPPPAAGGEMLRPLEGALRICYAKRLSQAKEPVDRQIRLEHRCAAVLFDRNAAVVGTKPGYERGVTQPEKGRRKCCPIVRLK